MTCFDMNPTAEHSGSRTEIPGINVMELDQIYCRQQYDTISPFQPHRVSYCSFICVEQGCGQHLIDGERHPYQSGSVIFLNRDQHHAFDPDDKPRGKMVSITPNFFSECSANIRHSYFVPFHLSLMCAPVLNLDPCQSQNCHDLLKQMTGAIADEGHESIVVALLFSALVLRLSRLRTLQSPVVDEVCRQRFTEFLNLVEQGFHLDREAQNYALKMHLSYKALNQLCKRSCGRTAKQIIDFRLNLEITRKLRMGEDCIQSIAFDMGFDDITNFVRYFKRNNGQTPSGYRTAYEQDAMNRLTPGTP
ncbi:helix-turn-helix transcriptional regulator [Marinobacter hydrocarbonoclasticus]|nr:helix-turn-helix transcriptional regulator [Marinobacter nauticus]